MENVFLVLLALIKPSREVVPFLIAYSLLSLLTTNTWSWWRLIEVEPPLFNTCFTALLKTSQSIKTGRQHPLRRQSWAQVSDLVFTPFFV
jgi:hypothetical protein